MTRGAGRGQSTVELALVLPVIALVLLLIIQVGLVLRAQAMVTNAAREAARLVAVTNDPGRAGSAVSGFDPASTRVEVDGSAEPGSDVTVSVHHDFATDVPLIGPLLGDVGLSASVTMRAEG